MPVDIPAQLASDTLEESLEGWRHVFGDVLPPGTAVDRLSGRVTGCVQGKEDRYARKIPTSGRKTPRIDVCLDYIGASECIYHQWILLTNAHGNRLAGGSPRGIELEHRRIPKRIRLLDFSCQLRRKAAIPEVDTHEGEGQLQGWRGWEWSVRLSGWERGNRLSGWERSIRGRHGGIGWRHHGESGAGPGRGAWKIVLPATCQRQSQ